MKEEMRQKTKKDSSDYGQGEKRTTKTGDKDEKNCSIF